MKKKIDMSLISGALVCLLPIALSAVFYGKLPDMVATHWGSTGIPDGFTPKAFFAFGLPLVFLALYVVVRLFLDNDPKKRNMSASMRAISIWVIPAMSLIMHALTIWNAIGEPVEFHRYVPAFVGFLIVVVGNYLPKCKQNYTMGIRLPWTLHSEDNWNRTHRFAGYLWIACGIAMIAGAFFPTGWLFISLVAVMVAAPALYSFLLYRKSAARDRAED